jgi:hypothetical protein
MDGHAERLKDAAACFTARKDRATHPNGKFVDTADGLLWQIDVAERRPCCDGVPTGNHGDGQRFANHWLNRHCRTVAHIANLYGVTEEDLRLTLGIRTGRRSSGQQNLF